VESVWSSRPAFGVLVGGTGELVGVFVGGTRAWLAAHQARLWVRQGNLGAATQWQQDRTFAEDSEAACVQQLTLVRLRLAQSQNASGKPFLDDASTLLRRLLPAFETHGWTRYLIEGLMLQAMVCQAQADKAGALNTLQRALTLAEAEGYIRLSVDEGAPLAVLLAHSVERRAQHDPLRIYAERLLSAFPDGDKQIEHPGDHSVSLSSTLPVASSLVEPLSDRELEVLRLIAAGHSKQAIADVLVVAVSTVKHHINNFYGKLGVQSRTQALVRARELNLL
jgi:LuxR family transcriptional regulator, maltose regulon positive regulatory protein